MTRTRIAALLLLPIFLVVAAHADEACDEYFAVGSGPTFTAFGTQHNGDNVGQGQTFTLNCGSRLISAVFNFTWGNACGDARSLAYGDSIHFSVLDMAGVEQVRDGYMVDTNVSSPQISWYFYDRMVLLPAGTYAAVCWTDAGACGGIRNRTTDLVAGQRYMSTTATDLGTWAGASGEVVSTITLDSDVTPAETLGWSAVKAMYR